MPQSIQLLRGLACLVACAAVGCDSVQSAQDHVSVVGGRAGGPALSGVAGAGNGTGLEDGELIAAALTINTAQIEQNSIAVSRAQTTRVMALAQRLVAMHMASQARENSLLARTTFMPLDNATSAMLRKASAETVSRLQQSTGPQFDHDYTSSQTDAYRMEIDLIDQSLLPSSRSAAMSTELATVRQELVGHWEEVRDMRDVIEGEGKVL